MTRVYARKIARNRWEEPEVQLDCEGIPADRITDLRTSGNTLSFWEAGTLEKVDLTIAVIALATSQERLAPLELTWIPEPDFAAEGLHQIGSAGDTLVPKHKDLHIDVVRLDHHRLSKVASLVSTALAKEQYNKLTKAQVLEILIASVRSGDLKVEDCRASLRDDLKKTLAAGDQA